MLITFVKQLKREKNKIMKKKFFLLAACLLSINTFSSAQACKLILGTQTDRYKFYKNEGSGFENVGLGVVAFHHIIPLNSNQDNKSVMKLLNKGFKSQNADYIQVKKDILQNLANQYENLLDNDRVKDTERERIERVKTYLEKLSLKEIDGKNGNCWNDIDIDEADKKLVANALAYMPGIGFFGPASISNDPGSKFDKHGKYFMTVDSYAYANQIGDKRLVNTPSETEILDAFKVITTEYTVQPYNKNLWKEQPNNKVCYKGSGDECLEPND
ncbi:predicted protein [Francisella philomiragia subsp. philomiragia ATCC 25015]|nr:predicted protein [Francisella philomiragia subsp. philomiragia ATCC 25015]